MNFVGLHLGLLNIFKVVHKYSLLKAVNLNLVLSEPSETGSIRQSLGCKTFGARHTQTVDSKSS